MADNLLSISAHEFRSPLGVAIGYLRMVLDERFGTLSEQQRHCSSRSRSHADACRRLSKSSSDLSQLESGKAPFNRGTVSLAAILADTIAGLPELPGPCRHGVACRRQRHHGPRRRGQAEGCVLLDSFRAPARAGDERLNCSCAPKRGTKTMWPPFASRSARRLGSSSSAAVAPLWLWRRSTSGVEATDSACRRRGESSRRMAAASGACLRRTRRRKPNRRDQRDTKASAIVVLPPPDRRAQSRRLLDHVILLGFNPSRLHSVLNHDRREAPHALTERVRTAAFSAG